MSFAAEGIAATRGGRALFAGLDFMLEPGGALVLTGPNGAGKSSLLRLIAGFGRPVAGQFAWDGQYVAKDPEAHRARLHYVGHLDALKPALTVAETIAFWRDLAGSPPPNPPPQAGEGFVSPSPARAGEGRGGGIDYVLEPFDLLPLADLPCRYLSSGQQRRLALSRLMAWRAPLWLLDEPTVGLDAASVEALAALCADHRAVGGMVIVSTHQALDLPGAETLSLADFPPARAVLAAADLDW